MKTDPKKNRKIYLSKMQERFAHEYLVDFNATQSAIRSGYSEKTAGIQGHRLLKNAKIKQKIQEIQQEFIEETKTRKSKILRELESIAFAKISDILQKNERTGHIELKDFDKMTEEQKGALALYTESYFEGEITTRKYKMHDKLKAIELLLKHVEAVENSGTGNSENEQKIEAMNVLTGILKNAYADRSGNQD